MKTGWLTIGELIDLVREDDAESGFHVYANDDLTRLDSPDDSIFVGPVSTFDKNMNEVLPEVVVEKGLGDFCSFELIEDVVSHALKRNPDADNQQIVEAIAYYMENDDFLDV